jgi:hypothetical protein
MGVPSSNSISNASRERMIPRMVVTSIAGIMIGTIMWKKVCQPLAPEMRDDSSRAASKLRKAGASSMTLTLTVPPK